MTVLWTDKYSLLNHWIVKHLKEKCQTLGWLPLMDPELWSGANDVRRLPRRPNRNNKTTKKSSHGEAERHIQAPDVASTTDAVGKRCCLQKLSAMLIRITLGEKSGWHLLQFFPLSVVTSILLTHNSPKLGKIRSNVDIPLESWYIKYKDSWIGKEVEVEISKMGKHLAFCQNSDVFVFS